MIQKQRRVRHGYLSDTASPMTASQPLWVARHRAALMLQLPHHHQREGCLHQGPVTPQRAHSTREAPGG